MLNVLDLMLSMDFGLLVFADLQNMNKMFLFAPNVAIIPNRLMTRLTSYIVTVIDLGIVPGMKKAASNATTKSEVTAIEAPIIDRTRVDDIVSTVSLFLEDPSLRRTGAHSPSPIHDVPSFILTDRLLGVVFAVEPRDCCLILLVITMG